MKKYIISLILIIILIILGTTAYFIINNNKDNREYEITSIKEYKYFVVKENGKYGVINSIGEIIIDVIYDDIKIPNPEKDVFICYTNEKTIVQNKQKGQILNKFQNIEPLRLKNVSGDLLYEKTVLKYSENGKYGIVSIEGKTITKAIYEDIDTLQFKEGELLVKQNGKYGVINIKGTVLVQIKYDKIEADGYYTESDGYKKSGYIVSNTKKEGYRYGYVGLDGKEYLPTEYNDINRINEIKEESAYLICAKNGKYGLYKNNKNIITNDYQDIIYNESNNVIIAQKVKRYGVFSIEGKAILPIEYTQIDITGKYIYAKLNDDTTKVFNVEGKETNISANTAYINVENTPYQIYIENLNNNTLYSIYEEQNLKTVGKYKYIEYLFNNYFIAYNEEGKIGIIDNNEKQKLEFIYSSIQKIKDTNMIQAKNANTNNIEIYNSNFEKICQMQDALIKEVNENIMIYNEKEIKYLSKEGIELNNLQVYSQNQIFAKEHNGFWGFVDANGNTVVDFKYNKVTEVNKYGFAGIYLNGKWGVINSQGEIITEPIYELKDEPTFIGKYYKVTYGFGEVYYTK